MEDNGVWIIAEQNRGDLLRVSFELLNRGRYLADRLNTSLSAVLFGSNIEEEAQELICHGADRVFLVDDPRLEYFLAEPYGKMLCALVKKYQPGIIIGAATCNGRTLMPYAAHKLKTGLTADCTMLEVDEQTGELLQTRPAIGGNIMATIKTPVARPQMATVRPRSMRPAPRDTSRRGEIKKEHFDDRLYSSSIKYIGFIEESKQDIPLQDADIVVAGGKGLRRAENFKLVQELARLLGAAEGASRSVVDLGWAPYACQVGLSGKTVTPNLYLALGISGAVQHLAGMQTAENIIAVNNDPEAQIFKVADLGIVADLFDVLPRLIEKLRERKSRERGKTDNE
ncbi:MAG: electron transfer flavoprotein subunit alpha/FixB family protein [Firmicutes bacterium]|nr:electron transfer flavoprotein subunit alpha/FixB family protein [Bacillota bacterium]